MKKLLSGIGILFCFVFLFSCKKSDEKLIIGTWEAKSVALVSYLDGVVVSQNTETFAANELTIEFKDNDTYTTFENGVMQESGNYSLNDDKLTIDGESSDYTISKKNLTIKTSESETVNGQTVRYDSEIKLDKK